MASEQDEQDAIIAQWMGWKRITDLTDDEVAQYVLEGWNLSPGNNLKPTIKDIRGQRIRWRSGGECDYARWMRPDNVPTINIPSYHTDLDLMAKALAIVRKMDLWLDYTHHLLQIVTGVPHKERPDKSGWWLVSSWELFTLALATASQQAEALIRVIGNE